MLLGDVIELRRRPLAETLEAGRGGLEAIGDALPADASLTLVAGNHDHRLVEAWFAGRDAGLPLGVAATVEPAAGDPLQTVVEALGADRTTVAYPGVWLREDVWATHGHYADRHTTVPMLERLGAGVTARIAGQGAGDPARAEDYEASLSPMYGFLDGLAQHGGPERGGGGTSARAWRALAGARQSRSVRRRAAAAAFPLGLAALNRAGIGPLRADLSATAMRTGPLIATGEVQRRLGVQARWIVFGHTHRAGPLPADDPAQWRTGLGAQLVNTGCWVRESVLAGPAPGQSPYRPGFAVWVDSTPGRAPELVNLLD